jgi:hypothetical protein
MNRLRRLLTSRWALAVGALMALIIVVEIAIRVLAPNGMTYTDTDPQGRILSSYSTSDSATVAAWYHYMNSQPVAESYPSCDPPLGVTPDYATLTFTLYGMPLQTWNGQHASDCDYYTRSAGFIPSMSLGNKSGYPINGYYIPAVPGQSPTP